MDQMISESTPKAEGADLEDPNLNKFSLPADKFSEFKEVIQENEDEFDYMISAILIQFLEKFNDRALEFPSCLDSQGRALIHAKCNFLGMASHSAGSGKTRRILVYPKHLFL